MRPVFPLATDSREDRCEGQGGGRTAKPYGESHIGHCEGGRCWLLPGSDSGDPTNLPLLCAFAQ